MNNLTITENTFAVSGDKVFFTLQGEGQSIGKPAVFLRLKFCNLRCGYCDTPYAVFPDIEDFKKEGQQWTILLTSQIIKEAWKVKNNKTQKRLVITGGEPMTAQIVKEISLVSPQALKLLPFTDIQIEEYKQLAEFDFANYQGKRPDDEEEKKGIEVTCPECNFKFKI